MPTSTLIANVRRTQSSKRHIIRFKDILGLESV